MHTKNTWGPWFILQDSIYMHVCARVRAQTHTHTKLRADKKKYGALGSISKPANKHTKEKLINTFMKTLYYFHIFLDDEKDSQD